MALITYFQNKIKKVEKEADHNPGSLLLFGLSFASACFAAGLPYMAVTPHMPLKAANFAAATSHKMVQGLDWLKPEYFFGLALILCLSAYQLWKPAPRGPSF